MSNAYVNAAKKLRVGKCPDSGNFKKNPIAKAILLLLADAANDEGFCFPGIGYIADVLELGESTVRKHLNYLDSEDFIVKKKIRRNNGYQMNFAPQKPKDDNTATTERSHQKPLRGSGIHETPPRNSGKNNRYRYDGEEIPLPRINATTERLNITLKGFETSNETFLDLNVWHSILKKIENKLNRQIFDSWFRFIKVEKIENKTITVSATKINQHWVLTYYADLFTESLGEYQVIWNIAEEDAA